ncbi:MAG: hypothetical protein KF713_17685 [Turneriella sp.]|nr:hypothetical protein [Turneriella sp.]
MQFSWEIALALGGVVSALIGIRWLRNAEAEVRSLRLAVLGKRTDVRGAALNRTIAAENAKLVAKGIDQGTLFLQGGHRLIADVTFAILQLMPSTRDSAAAARERHDEIAGNIYGAFRGISQHVGEKIAEDLQQQKTQKRAPRLARARRIAKSLKRRR